VLLSRLQFNSVLEDPELRIYQLEPFDPDAECLPVSFLDELGLLNKKSNKIYLYNRWRKFAKILDTALSVKADSSLIIKPTIFKGSVGVGKSCAVAAWLQRQAQTKSVVWIILLINLLL
jgi:hypothetical protein